MVRVLAAGVVAAACHHPAPAPLHNDAAPAGPLSGWVVVSQGAWLRAHASDRSEGGRAVVLQGAPTDDGNLEQVFVMRATGADGDWVTVENPLASDVAAHCYGTLPLDDFHLRLHVKRSDLLPVTQHAVDVSYPDGSGFALAAGVVVVGSRIGVDQFHPTLPVPRDAVDLAYAAPSPRLDQVKGDGVAWPDGTFRIDGQEVEIEEAAHDNTSLSGAIATLRLPCSRYHGVIEQDNSFGPGPAGTIGMGKMMGNVTDLPGVKAHAQLYWPDGSPAGETLASIDVEWGAGRHGDLSCFVVSLADGKAYGETRPSDDASLTLCAHRADWFDGYHL